jgi:hypothetical protein
VLGIPRHRWKDNIKMFVREVGWRGVGWINLAPHRNQRQALVNTKPSASIKCWEILELLSESLRRPKLITV